MNATQPAVGTERAVGEPEARHLPIRIIVNNKPVEVHQIAITVAGLKQLVGLPLEFDCYRVVSDKNEGPLANSVTLELHPGERFIITRGEDVA